MAFPDSLKLVGRAAGPSVDVIVGELGESIKSDGDGWRGGSCFVEFIYYKISLTNAVLCDHDNVSCIFPETSFSHKEETANIQSLQALVVLNPTFF